MEKQKVNDTVVHLGNCLVKARVHVAHRLSSKIRALRAKKNRKFANRIERLLLEIAYLKTLSRSGARKALARKMLLTVDDVAAKIERETTSPEERAFCRLYKTKCVENFISKFREENVDWRYWVPPLLAMWEAKVEMKKNRNLKPESSEEPKRLSVREIAEARKRKMDSDEGKDGGGDRKRAKRVEVVSNQPTEAKKKNKTANNRFHVEPMAKPDDSKNIGVKVDSDDPACVGEMEEDEPSSQDDGASEEEPASNAEEADERESSSSPKVCREPFRPYAPKHFLGGSGSDESASEVDDGNDRNSDHIESGDDESAGSKNEADSQDEEIQANCEDEDGDDDGEKETSDDESENEESDDDSAEESTPLRKNPASSAISVKQLEKVLDKDRNEDSDQNEEESSDEEEDYDDSVELSSDEDEDESDREREFEERIERKFKSNGSQKPLKVPVSSYEPESSEEEFPTQEKTSNARKDGSGSEEDEGDRRASSFFLRKGEQPEDVQSRTIPKDKAPGLNRRQRRGHEKQRSLAASNQDDSDEAEPRSNMTFGKDFRPRKSFQRQDRPQAFKRNKHDDRNFSGPRGPPGEGFKRNERFQSGKNPRASLPARFDRFSKQGGQRRSMNFSGEQRSDSRTSRDERRQDSRNEGQFQRPDKRFSERPARPSGQSVDQVRGDQRRGSNSGAFHRSRTEDTPKPGTEEKLHPSWLAKKKLSASLNQPFQGKKTLFDD